MNQVLRIAFIGAKSLPSISPVIGGVETHVEHLARHLSIRGHQLTVYVHQDKNPKNRKTFKGIRLVTLPAWNRKHFATASNVFLASLHALTEPYDIIHYHGVGPALFSWIPRLLKRHTKIVVTFHSRDQFHEKWGTIAQFFLAVGEWAAVRFPHETIATSHSIQLICKKLFRKEIPYIPNAVELPEKHISDKPLSKFNLSSGKYFLCLSRLVPHKAQDQLIRVFRGLDTDYKLAIVGSASYDDASYAADLRRLAGKDRRILFTGAQSGPTLHALIAHAYCMVHPSRSEGLSIAVLEGMSHGRLVIMSDISENLELIDHSGISFSVGEDAALKRAMEWALADPVMVAERGARAKELIRRSYSWDAVSGRIEELYKELFV